MAEITAALVKSLRDRSGAGMMDAKKALVESNGDVEAAIDWLRAKGLSKAEKKSGRTAADGLVAAIVSEDGKTGALVELNAETDFVARNETFQQALGQISSLALTTGGTTADLAGAPAPDGDGTVEDMIKRLVGTIGENMTLRRADKIEADVVSAYVHSAEAPNMGKIGVVVGLNGGGDADLARKVAMHVAATSPAAATVSELDTELVDRERQVLTEQAEQSGKPANVIEKMIEGRLNKYYKEVVLVEQPFVMDPDKTVGKFISESGAELAGFKMFKLGEGIEKEEDDFAAEVASMTKS
ncbi:MAG: translation elongation factor Ts [Pseudomonadota bacterium]